MSINIGVNNISRNVSQIYVGVNGVARIVKAVYIGVNGKARLVWQAIRNRVTRLLNIKNLGSLDYGVILKNVQAICKISDTHYLVGVYTAYGDDTDRNFLVNCYLNNEGQVSSFNGYETSYESNTNFQTTISTIGQINSNVGACVVTNRNLGNDSYSTREIQFFDLNNSSGAILKTSVNASEYVLPLVSLTSDTFIYPSYSSNGYVYGNIYKYSNNTCTRVYSGSLTGGTPLGYSPFMYGSCAVFPLSNNRFGSIFIIKQNYTEANTSTMSTIVNIYSYAYNSSGNFSLSILATHQLPFMSILDIGEMGDDYFVLSGGSTATGFHVDESNNVLFTNIISNTGGYCSKIANTDSVCCASGSTTTICYYDKQNNTIELTYKETTDINRFNVPYKNQGNIYCTVSGSQLYFNLASFS